MAYGTGTNVLHLLIRVSRTLTTSAFRLHTIVVTCIELARYIKNLLGVGSVYLFLYVDIDQIGLSVRYGSANGFFTGKVAYKRFIHLALGSSVASRMVMESG